MYNAFFDLKQKPFRITPDVQSFFTGGDRGAILRALVYAIRGGDAIIKLVGEVGSGKTMLCRMLEQYLPETVDIAYIANPRLTPDNILQTIAFELDLPLSNHECNNRVLMLGVLQNYLVCAHAEGRQVVVLVEEAQSIPIETLEEIRLLSNLETSQHKLLQVVLFGQPELDQILQTKSIRQISERISNSFYLQPLAKKDVYLYIQFRLEAAGYQGTHLFSASAAKLIFQQSGGLLRKINILCDKSLLAAWHEHSTVVKKAHAKRAAVDFLGPRETFISSKMVLSGLLSLVLTLALGMAWKLAPTYKSTVLINKLPPTQAGFANPSLTSKNRSNIIRTTQQLASDNARDISTPSLPDASERSKYFENRLKRSRQWLKTTNPDHFTIQVLLTNADANDELLKVWSQANSLINSDSLYYFRTQLRGNPMIEVIYGEYDSYSAARSAIKNLPTLLQKYQPYIRNIGRVVSTANSKTKSSKQGM